MTRNFTHMIVLNERLKKPHSISICLLGSYQEQNENDEEQMTENEQDDALNKKPIGPTIVFRMRKWIPSHQIFNKGNVSGHFPELILKNFTTALGRRVSRALSSLFPSNPEFKGRTVVTFHNQRDFLFLRHHRYIFEKGEKDVGIRLQELGPRFVLQLKKVYKGAFEEAKADFEFKDRDDLHVSRSKYYL